MGIFTRRSPEEKAAIRAQKEAFKPFHQEIRSLTDTMISNETRPLSGSYVSELLPVKAAHIAELYLTAVPSPNEDDINRLRKHHFAGLHHNSVPCEFRRDTHELAGAMREAILDGIGDALRDRG